eukprot:12425181-Alexandrium_andersonii.AAC.1
MHSSLRRSETASDCFSHAETSLGGSKQFEALLGGSRLPEIALKRIALPSTDKIIGYTCTNLPEA